MNLQSIIDAELKKEQEEKLLRTRSGCFSPSSLGRCYRNQVWNRRNEPISNPPDEKSLRIFAVGKIFHEFVENMMPEHQKEVKCKNEEGDVLGFADIVLPEIVWDIKSTNSFSFKYFNNPKFDIKKDKFTNWMQVGWYGMTLKKEKIGLCFINKDWLDVKEYWQYTKDWIPQIEAELECLRKYWASGELPPAVPRAYVNAKGESSDCAYCSWQKTCKEMEDAKNK